MGLKQNISISLFALFALFVVWFCCTDPVKPDFTAPKIGNNDQIQTYGTMSVDSVFGMFISAEGTSPLSFEWQKNRAPLYYSRESAVYDTLKFSPLTLADSGTYRCIVLNELGSDTSKEFELKPYSDTIKPVITLLSPQDGFISDDSILNITFKVFDEKGVSSVKVNGTTVTSADSIYNHTLKLKTGLNKDTIIAVDASTKKNSDTLLMTFTYDPTFTDTIQPVITLISPQNGSTTDDSLLNIKFKVTDKSGISSVTVNGVSVATTDSIYNNTLKLSLGLNKDTIIAVDASTRKNSDTLLMTFTYDPTFTDTIQPVITLISPQNGSTTGDSLLNIKFKVTDKSGISSVKVNGATVASNDSVYNHTLTLKKGLNKDTIIATDASTKKNRDTLLMTFTYDPTFTDTIQPVITLISPQNGSTTGDSLLNIKFKVTDKSGISSVKVNGATVASNDSVYNHTLTLKKGLNKDTIIAVDASTKKNSDTLLMTFTYDPTFTDTIGPDIDIISPVNGTHLKTSPVDVTVNVNDQSGVAWVTINGDTAALSGSNYTKSISLLPGKNPIKVKAQDKSIKKNVDSASIAVTYDNAKPSLKTMDPGVNNSSITVDSIVLQMIAKDNIGIKEVKFTVGVNQYPTSVFEDSIFYAKIKNLAPNVFTTIKVIAVDSATNDSAINVLVKYDPSLNDLLPPVINQLSGPTDNARVKTAQNSLSFDITDANGLDTVYFTDNNVFQGKLDKVSGSQYECTSNFGTSYGLHTLRIYAIDNSANHNQQIKVIRIIYNTAISAVTNTSPANGVGGVALQTQFSWSGGNDPDKDIVTYTLYYGTASNSLTELIDADTNKTVQAPTPLTGNTRYFWKVTAYSATHPEDSVSSTVTNFTTLNQPPVVSGILDQTIPEGAGFTAINLDNHVTDIDNHDSTIIWTYEEQSQLAVSITNRVATITTPNTDYNGSASIIFVATDPGGLSDKDTAVFVVTPVNDAPSFTKGQNQDVSEDGGQITVSGWAKNMSPGPADENGQTLTFSTSNNHTSLFTTTGQPKVNESTGDLTYTLAPDSNGSANVTVSLKDNGGTANGGADSSAAQTFTITVTAVNDAPLFTKGADQTVAENAGVQSVIGWATGISAGPANESGQILTFTCTNNSSTLFSVQPAVASNGTLNYTSATNTNGSATVTVTLKDNGGTANGGVDEVVKTFTVTVVVKDADGNIYTTVTIGTQTWMVENLKTTRYNDGTAIPVITDNVAWSNLTSPGYCWYNNDINNKNTYGALYNWHTVNTDKLAPAGWKVPTDGDWTVLQNYLIANGYNWDGTTTDNKIGKSMASKTDWAISTTQGHVGNNPSTNNGSGFSAFPGGFRMGDGNFDYFGSNGQWWSATEDDANFAFYRYLLFDYAGLDRSSSHKSIGYSVRLIRD